jgi:hypothetical protein
MIASAFCGDGRRASVSGGPLAVCPSPSQAGYRRPFVRTPGTRTAARDQTAELKVRGR